MAPVDRQQHRKERMRGAGFANSSAPKLSFNFSIPPKAAKQTSLPPQRSSRRSRTPVVSTPRAPSASAQRPRSASAPRSASNARNTPRQSTGKRKRGQKHAHAAQGNDDDDGELDPLSPDNDQVRSIEKSRKVAGPVSPIREDPGEADEADELSILGDDTGSARKVGKESSEAPQETPAAAKARRRSLQPAPTTPAIIARRPMRHSASSSHSLNISHDAESEDELATPQPNSATPRPVSRAQSSQPLPDEGQEMGMDELSPLVQLADAALKSLQNAKASQRPIQDQLQPEDQQPPPQPANRRKRRVVDENEDLVQTTPAASKPRRISKSAGVEEPDGDDEPDEISPESAPSGPSPINPAHHNSTFINLSPSATSSDNLNGHEPAPRSSNLLSVSSHTMASDNFDEQGPASHSSNAINATSGAASSTHDSESEQEEESPDPTPRAAPTSKQIQVRSSPKQKPRTKPANDKPPTKRQKLGGLTQSIQVMRIKGNNIKGYTVADTTRTAMEEYIDERISLLSARFQTTQDLARKKQIKTRINLQLSFKEALSERMLDLQDVNDSLTTRAHKLKLFKRHNSELRKDILATQNSRQELAFEYDNVLAEFDMEKEAFEATNRLSTSMFDIQAAIQRGRDRARGEGRVDEGPDIPLSMFLANVGRDVGSLGGGLLDQTRRFNGLLEKAADFLEGRA